MTKRCFVILGRKTPPDEEEAVSGRYDAWQCHFASFITGPFQETFLRRKRPNDVCVILRAGTSVGDSAANSHFEAHDRLPPTDDDGDSIDVTPH